MKKEPLALESERRKQYIYIHIYIYMSQTSLCTKEERIVNVFILKRSVTVAVSIKG